MQVLLLCDRRILFLPARDNSKLSDPLLLVTFEGDPLPGAGHDAVALQHVAGRRPDQRPVTGDVLEDCIL